MDKEEVDTAGREERPRLRGYQWDKPGAGRRRARRRAESGQCGWDRGGAKGSD